MVHLREIVESDLELTLEDDWGLPVVLYAPDGTKYDKSANDTTKDLVGQVLYDTRIEDPATGAEIIVHKPVITLRKTSLTRIPISGEKWIIEIPTTPEYAGTKTAFYVERPSEDGSSIGFIRLYLMAADQS